MTQVSRIDESSLRVVLALIAGATELMNLNGIHQWDEIYPDRAILEADLRSGTSFGIFEDGVLAGYVVLNEQEPPEYSDIDWCRRSGRRLVIHRLCVHPDHRGKGYGKRLVSFAEEQGRHNGYASIRLDAFSENGTALALYESAGFLRRGTVRFRKGDFFCYEKELG
jgi:Acetyltransferases